MGKKNGREIDRRELLPTVNRKLARPSRRFNYGSRETGSSTHTPPTPRRAASSLKG